jgi:hypothetical protein
MITIAIVLAAGLCSGGQKASENKSPGLRIPKELAEKYRLKEELILIPEDGGIRIVA